MTKMFMIIYSHKINFMEESIYNIIQKEQTVSPHKPIYKSKFPYNIAPTASTFGHHTTSKPGISNLSGEFNLPLQPHCSKGATQTFGHLKGDRKPMPQNYQRKHTGTMGNSTLPPVRNFSYDCSHKKERVPRSSERPVHGLKSDRNFVVSNAVEAILSSAKRLPKQVDWKKKKDYGQNPQYLDRIKRTLHDEYKMIQTLHSERQQKKKMLSEEEVMELREGLKEKWTQVNRQYQKIAHVRIVDTEGLRRKKLNLEKQLAQLENDIRKLNKAYILVDD